LLIVISLVAIASAVASLALRDPSSTQLEREATRLAALLESARAEARAAGLQVLWVPSRSGEKSGFRFVGLPPAATPPENWLGSGVEAEVLGARAAVLGPEPVIGAQRIVLRLEDQRLMLVTDGLGPFVLGSDEVAQ
jgi:general secretion pathway protein H